MSGVLLITPRIVDPAPGVMTGPERRGIGGGGLIPGHLVEIIRVEGSVLGRLQLVGPGPGLRRQRSLTE